MKKSIGITLAVLCSFALSFLVGGCSEKDELAPDASVNVPAQITALKGNDNDAIQEACVQLAKAGSHAAPAVNDLIPILKHQDPVTRRLAAYALGRIGPAAKEAIPALEPLKQDPDINVVQQVNTSLSEIDPQRAPAAP